MHTSSDKWLLATPQNSNDSYYQTTVQNKFYIATARSATDHAYSSVFWDIPTFRNHLQGSSSLTLEDGTDSHERSVSNQLPRNEDGGSMFLQKPACTRLHGVTSRKSYTVVRSSATGIACAKKWQQIRRCLRKYPQSRLRTIMDQTQQRLWVYETQIYKDIHDTWMRRTRWFKYDRDYLCVNKSQFVPVIFEPPCRCHFKTACHSAAPVCVCVCTEFWSDWQTNITKTWYEHNCRVITINTRWICEHLRWQQRLCRIMYSKINTPPPPDHPHNCKTVTRLSWG
jgi:hypothetical protein